MAKESLIEQGVERGAIGDRADLLAAERGPLGG
jgi:hypothetical protein